MIPNRSICFIDGTLWATTTTIDQCGPGSNGNERSGFTLPHAPELKSHHPGYSSWKIQSDHSTRFSCDSSSRKSLPITSFENLAKFVRVFFLSLRVAIFFLFVYHLFSLYFLNNKNQFFLLLKRILWNAGQFSLY